MHAGKNMGTMPSLKKPTAERAGPAPRDPPERQAGPAAPPGRGREGQGHWRARPLVHAPGQPRHNAGLHGERTAVRPACGGGGAERAPLRAHGRLGAAPPGRQARTAGRQRTGARPHPPQAPHGQDGGVRCAPVGHVRLDDPGPCGDTGGQDIGILLGGMGARHLPIRCPIEAGLVTSTLRSYCHFSKTYCRKPFSPVSGGGKRRTGAGPENCMTLLAPLLTVRPPKCVVYTG